MLDDALARLKAGESMDDLLEELNLESDYAVDLILLLGE